MSILLTDKELPELEIKVDINGIEPEAGDKLLAWGRQIAKAQLKKVDTELQVILEDDKWVNNVRSGIEQFIDRIEKEVE